GSAGGRARAAQAAEDSERIAGDGLPDELSARLDRTVNPRRQGLRILPGGRSHDQVPPAALDRVSLLLEPIGELARGRVRGEIDAHLPGCVAAFERLLFPRLARRLVAPAVFLVLDLDADPVIVHGL